MNNYPSYNHFKTKALNYDNDIYTKIGFNSKLRNQNIDNIIFNDITNKLDITNKKNLKILDIGCGCSDLVYYIIDLCKINENEIHLIDSKEMLQQINHDYCIKHNGKFPDEHNIFFHKYINKFDIIICYSVLHHIYEDSHGNVNLFLDMLIQLLNKEGKLFIGDIPNTSKQNKFIKSEKGINLHKEWQIKPKKHYTIEETRIDDNFIFNILLKYRNYNCNTYLLPQPDILPMNYVREDILIIKN